MGFKRYKRRVFLFLLFSAAIFFVYWAFVDFHLYQRIIWVSGNMQQEPVPAVYKLENPAAQILDLQPVLSEHPYLTSAFQLEMDRKTHSALTADNKVRLLMNHVSSERRLQLLHEAKHTAHIASFMLSCDGSGEDFVREAILAHTRGVDVRFLIDGNLMNSINAHCLDKLRVEGIPVILTHPYFFLSHATFNVHEKLQIVDNQIAVTGGQNIGDWWARANGFDGNFRDTDIEVNGPAARQMEKRFLSLWHKRLPQDTSIEPLQARLDDQIVEDLAKGVLGPQHYAHWLSQKPARGLCRFVGQDPKVENYDVVTAYEAYTDSALQRMMFEVITFNGQGTHTLDRLQQSLLRLAKNKNGRVDVITNANGWMHSNAIHPFLGWFFTLYFLSDIYSSTLNTPLHVYGYNTLFHSKVYYWDGLAVAVGSFNFDETSSIWMESTLICIDPSLVRQTEDMFALDVLNSRKYDNPTISK